MTGGSSPYDKPAMHEAVIKLQEYIRPSGMELSEVALRWLVWHSGLGEGDGVVLGGSRVSQIERNLGVVGMGRLEGGLVGMVEGVWGEVRGEGG